MTRRRLDHAPQHGLPGTVRYINPDDPNDYLEIVPLEIGTLEVRSSGFTGPLIITPHVSNEIEVGVRRRG